MYGNICSTAAIINIKVNLIPVQHVHIYIIMIITGFIRRSTQIFEIVLLLAISANSCIRSDMQTSLNLSMSLYMGTDELEA